MKTVALMYGISSYPIDTKLVTINVCNCSVEEICYIWGSSDFLSSMTSGCDGVLYAVQYGNGLLYGIDPKTCDMWSIGGGGTGMLGIAYDPFSYWIYGSSENNYLYKINPKTGEQELVGPFGSGVQYMVGMAFDAEGVLYGWDLGQDCLWTIDTETGEATKVGSLGISLNYAVDGDFHRDSDTLYLIAYTHGTCLYKFDKTKGQSELVCCLHNGEEVTACCFLNSCKIPEHDVSIKSIDYPESGYAIPEIPMQVTVENKGNNTETTDVNMQVLKFEAESVVLEEDFSGTFPPDGWETDFWNKSYTNVTGGTSPEARVYKYDQYYESQYYDNYITSKPIDCTGAEKVNIRFRWAADYEHPQYSSVYVKFRSNSTSKWTDITPWENPHSKDQKAKLWETNLYDLGESIGEDLQIKWVYIGYYDYYNYLWLDDIEIITYTSSEEYNDTIKNLKIEKGETVSVKFKNWTSSYWQNHSYENSWVDFRVKACTLLDDERPDNDCKYKPIDLYYPWMHDVEIKSIDSPCEDGPGKTYSVNATIKNIGQNAESHLPINIKIDEPIFIDTLLFEDSWNTVPPEGWYDEHKKYNPNYGWKKSNSSFSGGSSPEAYIEYKALADYYFYSYPIDTSDYSMLRLRFKTYIDDRSGQSQYSLKAGYSTDKETWYTAWHEEPDIDEQFEVDVLIKGSSKTTYIGFWIKGSSYDFNHWYLDDVELVAIDLKEEYFDSIYYESEIEPGEEKIFNFDDWTPDFLQNETTGKKDYIVEALIELEDDMNPDNDMRTKLFTLDYWHDVGIDRITSPVSGGHPRLDELVWDNGEPDGVNGLFFGQYSGYDNWLIDDFEITQKTDITGIKLNLLWEPGYSKNLKTMWICIVKETDHCDPDPADPPYALVEATDFVEYTTGNFYFSRPEVVVEAEFEVVTLQPGTWWIGAMPVGIADAYAYWLTAPMQNCVGQWHAEYLGYPRWSPVSNYGYNYNFAWSVYGGDGPPKIKTWIQPGTEDIDAVVKNYGTFTKEDLTAYAQIREFITDPENGTEVYTDEIRNIDLMEPLGGEKNLQFSDFTFSDEGRYGLFIQLPADPDDVQKNNNIRYGIGVDDTNPVTDPHILDPPYPDGLNGWYVSDVTVTLNAYDPLVKDVSSGVKEIRYSINGGPEQVIPGETGSFVLRDDGKDILIEYWAIDNVGNFEFPKHSFEVSIDQTEPKVALDYEISGTPFTGWIFTFTAIATDDTSGIDFVEFYFNDLLQETVIGPGPEFEWTFKHYGGLEIIITSIAYNKAGLSNSDHVDAKISIYSSSKINQRYRSNNVLQIPYMR